MPGLNKSVHTVRESEKTVTSGGGRLGGLRWHWGGTGAISVSSWFHYSNVTQTHTETHVLALSIARS